MIVTTLYVVRLNRKLNLSKLELEQTNIHLQEMDRAADESNGHDPPSPIGAHRAILGHGGMKTARRIGLGMLPE